MDRRTRTAAVIEIAAEEYGALQDDLKKLVEQDVAELGRKLEAAAHRGLPVAVFRSGESSSGGTIADSIGLCSSVSPRS